MQTRSLITDIISSATPADAPSLGHAFKQTHPNIAVAIDAAEDELKQARKMRKECIHFLASTKITSRNAPEIANRIKIVRKKFTFAQDYQRLADRMQDNSFGGHRYQRPLVSTAQEKHVDDTSFLRATTRLDKQAQVVNELHNLASAEQREIAKRLHTKENLSNATSLKRRLEEAQKLDDSTAKNIIISFLEENIAILEEHLEFNTLRQSFRQDALNDNIARAAFCFGFPVQESIDLVSNFMQADKHHPLKRIPLFDTKKSNPKLTGLIERTDLTRRADLQPVYNFYQRDIPLFPISAIRLAMMERYPSTDPTSRYFSFVKSMRNLDAAQQLHYDVNKVHRYDREPHFMGLGSWSELRTGLALLKIHAEDKTYFIDGFKPRSTPDMNRTRIITDVIPCINQRGFDCSGADYLIRAHSLELGSDVYIPLQVKSSHRGLEEMQVNNLNTSAITVSGKSMSNLCKDLKRIVNNPRIIISPETIKKFTVAFDTENEQHFAHAVSEFQKILRGHSGLIY